MKIFTFGFVIGGAFKYSGCFKLCLAHNHPKLLIFQRPEVTRNHLKHSQVCVIHVNNSSN